MAATGQSRVISDRRWEDYRSLKQHYQHRHTKEFVISGNGDSSVAGEIQFNDLTIHYIAAEGQVYIRTELDDLANQDSKYVYIEYQDDTGAIKTILTADLDNANTTTEVIVTGASDFYRLRQMYSEVEATATKAIVLTDAVMGGADDHFGVIEDGNSQFAAQRYFVPDAASVPHSYLGRIIAQGPQIAAAAAAVDAIILTVTYTPKIVDIGEAQIKADITAVLTFNKELDWQPCIELEPATEVSFSWTDTTTGQAIWFEADFLEVYAKV